MKGKQKIQETKSKNSLLSRLSLIGSRKERDYLIENLTMMLASGMDISASLGAIKKEIRSKALRRKIAEIEEDILSGSPLWRALDRSRLLPDHVIALVRIGEETGRLAENLKVIVIQQEKDRMFRSKIRSAMLYPIIVVTLTLIIGIGISWFILPRLATVFASLRLDLPAITRALITAGEFLGEYGAYAVPFILLLIIFIVYLLFFNNKVKFIGEKIIFSFPLIKNMVREIELARTGFILGTLLDAGMPIVQAFDSLHKASSFRDYRKLFMFLRDQIEEGNSLEGAFQNYPKINKRIPVTVQQMVASGERTGTLPETLLKVGQTFEAKSEVTTKNLTVVLEPVLLVIVWSGVVMIALAVILPIYSLIGGLNEQQNPTTPPPAPAAAPPPPITEPEKEEEVSKVIILNTPVGYLNVRQEPDVESALVTRVLPGEVYEYTDEENGWYEIVISDEETGWITGDYAEVLEPEDESEPEEQTSEDDAANRVRILPTGIGYLNVRSAPSLSGAVIATVNPGEIYEYADEDNGWYEIVLSDDRRGWIIEDYVEIIQ